MHNKKPTIYLVAVDMDGTLLHNDKSISDYTINVLRKIVEKGILLVPASGRPLNGMKAAVLNNVKGIKYAICSNGAMLMDVQKEKSISETGIPTEKALKALAYLEQFPVAVYVHTDKGTFRAEGWEKTGLSEKYPYIRFSEGNVKNLGEFLKTSGVNVMKMGAFVLTDELAQKLMEKYPDLEMIAGMNEYSAVGVGRAVSDAGVKDRIDVVGVDCSQEAINLMEMGVYKGIIVQKAFRMGYIGVEETIHMLNGDAVEKNIDSGCELVTPENMYDSDIERLIFPFG